MAENQKCPLDADAQFQRNLTVCSKPDQHHRNVSTCVFANND